ncbi:LpxL/LpxP family acyltransferase [Lentisalinibacter orientalis]|uniref:LpxL/LpxP family acyltransferase n=1 Tax=Lentisalinibacter orientalis TaxID=2992241 RepID=UPI00386D7CA5
MNDAGTRSAAGESRGREALIRAALALQRALVLLPWRAQRLLGRGLGAAAFRLAGRRRRIAARNLELCFPELTADARQQLLRRHFRSLGIGLMELGMAWWASDRRLRAMATLEGLEHLEAARAAGRPVILIAGHFTTMDLACRLLGLAVDYDGIQRPFGYPALDRQLTRGRLRAVGTVYSKFDLRGILDALARGRTLWMAVDQAQTSSRPVLASFFGLPAPTTGSPARLAARSGAAVLPVAGRREPDGHYRITVEPALEDFPGGDEVADAARLNAVVERQARAAPDQYYWIHRRFKGDPAHYDDV